MPITSGKGSSSSGTRYRIVQNPGQSFPITCSPSVVFSGTAAAGPPITGSGNGLGFLSYSATAQPLEVVLSGGIGTKNSKKYLIGQHVTATLSTGGLTADSLSWFVMGGSPFKDWTAYQDEGRFTAFVPETTNPIGFYFKKPDSGPTVTCYAHLAVPAGARPANGFVVAADRQCGVVPPASATFDVSMGSVSLRNPPPQPTNSIGFGGLRSPEYGDQDVGIVWKCQILTPAAFTQQGPGGWNFIQLISMDRHHVYHGTDQGLRKNGHQCLDNFYPYAPLPNGVHPGYAGMWSADGIDHRGADDPFNSVFYGSGEVDSVNMEDGFRTWLMYLPPGDDSRYVPIRKIAWYWHGAATRTAPGVWNMTSQPNYCAWGFEGDLYPEHPEWQEAMLNGRDLSDYTPVVW